MTRCKKCGCEAVDHSGCSIVYHPEEWATPIVGEPCEGSMVRSVAPTATGGAIVVLADGTKIKYNDKGRELHRARPAKLTMTCDRVIN